MKYSLISRTKLHFNFIFLFFAISVFSISIFRYVTKYNDTNKNLIENSINAVSSNIAESLVIGDLYHAKNTLDKICIALKVVSCSIFDNNENVLAAHTNSFLNISENNLISHKTHLIHGGKKTGSLQVKFEKLSLYQAAQAEFLPFFILLSIVYLLWIFTKKSFLGKAYSDIKDLNKILLSSNLSSAVDSLNKFNSNALEISEVAKKVKINFGKMLKYEANEKRDVVNQVIHDLEPLTRGFERYANQFDEANRLRFQRLLSSIKASLREIKDEYSNYDEDDKSDFTFVYEASQEAKDAMLEIATEKNIDLKFNFSTQAKIAGVSIPSNKLSRMLTNMVNNSIQAIDEKLKDSEISGQIELKADIVDNSYYISITDNGKGISSTDLELLKINGGTFNKAGGKGLGLKLVREELEKANGQLFIDSSLNQGTKIELIIPVAEKPNWITTIINKKNDKVLVLEDNEYNFEELENYLDYNYVQWLKNPSQYSSDHFEEAEFDIICDYDFFNSNINGLDFLEINNFKNAVLFTSYHSDPKVQKRAKELEIKILPKFIITDRVFPVKTKITTDPIFPSTQIRNLYLIEDDEIQGTILKEELEEKGIHCNVFKSYDEFRSEASPSKEDIIISDLHLGEYNNKEGFNYGVNLCKDLNSNGFKKIMLFSNEFDNIENIESVRNECPFVLNFIYKKDEDIIKSIKPYLYS